MDYLLKETFMAAFIIFSMETANKQGYTYKATVVYNYLFITLQENSVEPHTATIDKSLFSKGQTDNLKYKAWKECWYST